MNDWIINYIITTIFAVIIAAYIIPKILLIAFRCNLYDTADSRKIHTGVVPRLGGISFLPALGVAFFIVAGVNAILRPEVVVPMLSDNLIQLLFLGAALLIIYLLGIADDLIGVRYRGKFVFQIIGGILLAVSGLWVKNFYGFLWIEAITPWIGWTLTVFASVYVLNALNLIDGIDGLASGLSIVALAWYSCLFYSAGEYVPMLLAGASLGTLLPFFYYNVFGKASAHTKIFMGDTGSLTIGMILVYLALKVDNIVGENSMEEYNLFILAIAPILIPCFDVARVFLHRLRSGRNPFLPDNSHIHHKLLALGMVQNRALILILLADAVIILLNLWCSAFIGATWILLADILLWTALNLYLTALIRKRERKLNKSLFK